MGLSTSMHAAPPHQLPSMRDVCAAPSSPYFEPPSAHPTYTRAVLNPSIPNAHEPLLLPAHLKRALLTWGWRDWLLMCRFCVACGDIPGAAPGLGGTWWQRRPRGRHTAPIHLTRGQGQVCIRCVALLLAVALPLMSHGTTAHYMVPL